MRVVLDTNIWISGLLWRGLPWKLLRLAEARQVEICMAPSILEELERVLAYERLQPRLRQLGLSPEELAAYVMDIVVMFELPPPSHDAPLVIVDPDDDIFIRCALAAEAHYIISGDSHLLDLKQYALIHILTIRAFFEEMFPLQLSEP
jgi:putative PIN family toxin of toxin-antitoxin system